MNNKILFAKKMIGKRVAVIDDYKKSLYYYGIVESVSSEDTFVVKNEQDERKNVSIFDIRNPSQEIL